MTKSQRLQLEASRKRQRIAELLKIEPDKLTDEQRSELDSLTTRCEQIEVEYRAAIVEEGGELEIRTTPADAERREFLALEQRAQVSEFVGAAIEGRSVQGASLEFSQACNSGGRLPLRLLAPTAEELETRAATATDAGTSQASWLDRLFFGTAAAYLGVSMRSVAPGVAAFPVTTAGAAAAQRAKSEAAADAAWTVGVTELKPSRNAVRAVFNIEDAARLRGLEDALRRDLRAALVEGIDRAIFNGDAGANGNNADAADITGLQGAGITETTLTQAAKVKGPDTLAAFLAMVDGMHASSLDDLRVVTSVGANTLWGSTVLAVGSETASVFKTLANFLRENGMSWMARGGIETDTANGDFGAYIGRQRGIDGAGIAAVWDAGDLIRDPYSGAAEGEVALTLSYLWNFGIPRTSNFQRIKFVT